MTAHDKQQTPSPSTHVVAADLEESVARRTGWLVDIISRCEEHVIESELTFKTELLADIRAALATATEGSGE